jgi:alpha-beta hydrolase superfamily lysophospholipase
LNLYAQAWSPESPQGVVCLVHGLGEHSGRYAHVADRLNTAGYAVLASDLRGHGKSAGQRGHAPSMEAFMKDIDLLLEEAKRRYPHQPRFLYGHSLGGILVLNYTLRRRPELAGVVATSSGLRTALELQKGKIALVKLLGSVMQKQTIASGLDAATISRDPEVVKKYLSDPLVHDKITFGMAKALSEAIPWVFAHASEFKVPLLLMHGTADQLAFPAGSKEFASLVHGDCTLKLWEGLYHETHNEPEKDEVLAYMVGWLESHKETVK